MNMALQVGGNNKRIAANWYYTALFVIAIFVEKALDSLGLSGFVGIQSVYVGDVWLTRNLRQGERA